MFAAYHAKAYEQAQAFLAKAEPGIRDKLTKGISGGGAADKGGRPGVIHRNLCRMNERRTSEEAHALGQLSSCNDSLLLFGDIWVISVFSPPPLASPAPEARPRIANRKPLAAFVGSSTSVSAGGGFSNAKADVLVFAPPSAHRPSSAPGAGPSSSRQPPRTPHHGGNVLPSSAAIAAPQGSTAVPSSSLSMQPPPQPQQQQQTMTGQQQRPPFQPPTRGMPQAVAPQPAPTSSSIAAQQQPTHASSQPSSVAAQPSPHVAVEASQPSNLHRPPSAYRASCAADLPPMIRAHPGRKSLATFGMPGRVLGLPADVEVPGPPQGEKGNAAMIGFIL